MAKPAEIETPVTEFEQTLEEFCQDFSRSDKRVELISGFYAEETRHGRHKGLASAFADRFAAFAARPV